MNQKNPVTEQDESSHQEGPTTTLSYEPTPTILSDIFAFPWIPFRLSVDSSEEYEAMGTRGSVVKVLSLAILNGLAAVWGLWMIIGGNPYIDLADDLNYPL